MKYEVKTVSLDRMIITPVGVLGSLCDNCQTADCTHQIEITNVSMFGINKKMRCLISGNTPCLVAACRGHTPKK